MENPELTLAQAAELRKRLVGSIADRLTIYMDGVGTFNICSDHSWLARMCQQAMRNRSQSATGGPVTVRFRKGKRGRA